VLCDLSHAINGQVPAVAGAVPVTTSLPFESVVPALNDLGGFSFTVQPMISVLAGNPVKVTVYCSPALTVFLLRLIAGFVDVGN